MGSTLKHVLATAPLAVALTVVGMTGTADAASKASAEPSGVCRIFASGIPIRQFVSTQNVCALNAAALTLTLGNVVTYTWFPVVVGASSPVMALDD
jgi:hypothetical protein